MEFFPSGLNGDESEQTVALMEAHQKEHGFCFFAAELVGKAPFIGFIGISNGPFEAPFTPAVEVGWRLARPYWNRGLATEGATAVLSYAFLKVQLNEVVSFTVPANIRSRRVMEKVGMTHDRAADFDHPRLPAVTRYGDTSYIALDGRSGKEFSRPESKSHSRSIEKKRRNRALRPPTNGRARQPSR
jgi:RimJ/RimL family protein N-acetyltransferase